MWLELEWNLQTIYLTMAQLGKINKKQEKGFLRFNNSFLSDPEYLEANNLIIRDTIREYSIEKIDSGGINNNILSSCETNICPILLLKLILAKPKGRTNVTSSWKIASLERQLWEGMPRRRNGTCQQSICEKLKMRKKQSIFGANQKSSLIDSLFIEN